MGLVRQVLKLVPAVALFAAGYYVGTVDSGEYQCVFEEQAHYDTRGLELIAQAPYEVEHEN